MKDFDGQAARTVSATADKVFDLLTDVDRLPDWNTAIEQVRDRPDALVPGSEWTVKMHPPHMPSWGSISRVTELDRDAWRFSYETRNADGNPSSVAWSWQVDPASDESASVTVTWHCDLRTLDRKLLAGPMRKRQLNREVPASLAALAASLVPTT